MYNYQRTHQGLGGFLVPGDRFHGREDQVIIDVKAICEIAGISRKTGYQWADKLGERQDEVKELQAKYERLKVKDAELEKRLDDLRFENEGRKLAWEIHGVDEFIASKKKALSSHKKQRG